MIEGLVLAATHVVEGETSAGMELLPTGLLVSLFVFVLAVLLGFEVISKVPPILHTPLMSGSNAISGIVLIGALVVVVRSDTTIGTVLGIGAVALATINVVGGFMVTDRMLQMFKKRPDEPS